MLGRLRLGLGEDGLARQALVFGRLAALLDADDLMRPVDVVGPALVELDAGAGQAADRLEGGAELEGADGRRGE